MIPVSLSLNKKKILIIGGGEVAYRKTLLFLQEQAQITVVSPTLCPQLKKLEIHYIQDCYQIGYLKDMFLVYVATNNLEVNHQVVKDCQERHILCGSATYHQDASFYSMAFQEHELATIALSMHQKMPYMKPILQQLTDVLNDNQERIEKIVKLRSYIIQNVHDKQKYFASLYTCQANIFHFIYESIQQQAGTLFIYHQSQYQQDITLTSQPSLLISFEEYKHNQILFDLPISYHVVPLLLYEGKIYRDIQYTIPNHWTISRPLIDSKKDIQFLISLFQKENDETIWIIHPRNYSYLKNKLFQETQKAVYELDDPLFLDKQKKYFFIIMLMTSGKHYHDFVQHIHELQKEGYQIEYNEPLMSNQHIISYIEKHRL